MRAFLEKYGLAIFVLVVIGIMIGMGPIIGNTFSNQLQNEVTAYTDHEGEMIVGSTFNSMIPNEATSVVFTWRTAPEGASLTDVSVMGDGSVVAWLEGTTFMVSTQKFEKPIIANSNCYRMFYGKTNLVYIDFGNLDTSSVTTMTDMFSCCRKLSTLNLGDNFDTVKVTSMTGMFYDCQKLNALNLEDKFDTSHVVYMNSMFNNCIKLTSLNLGDKFDTSNVTNMSSMFNNCLNLTIDCSSWNITKVTNHNAFKYNAPHVIEPTWL